jgi:hypothetical protein
MEAVSQDRVWSLEELGTIGDRSRGIGDMIFDSRFSWRHPYGWRTKLRILMPVVISERIDKGEDCESCGGQHRWYNQDDEHSACYYCKIVRRQVWKKHYFKNSPLPPGYFSCLLRKVVGQCSDGEEFRQSRNVRGNRLAVLRIPDTIASPE